MSWLVLGAGISGCGAAALLRSKNQQVSICDDRPLSPETAQRLGKLGVSIAENSQDPALLIPTIQGLVLSPGVPHSHPLVVAATQKNIPIVSEIDIALQFFKGKLIGITGTNGKSTVAAMTYHLLKRDGCDVALAGNIGISLCQHFAEHSPPAILVVELSSYQLELSQRVHADVGIIVNLTPDHLERHGNELSYYTAKWRLFINQTPSDHSFITEEAWKVSQKFALPKPPSQLTILSPQAETELFSFSSPEIASSHNRQNAAAAILAVAALLKRTPATIAPLIVGYQSLPFRYEIIAQHEQFSVINDSKGTNVAATLTALASTSAPLILMLGGKGKGESFLPICAFKDRISRIIAFGYSAPEISKELKEHFPLISYPTLKEALVAEKFESKTLKSNLLFSPACASYDEFGNFEERGSFFNSFFRDS
jgi:UDP-N-acetylmuramoylalanine--D-glutamate ligase